MDSKSSTPVHMPLNTVSVSPPPIQRHSALYFMDREREEAEAKEETKEKRQTNEHDGQFGWPFSSPLTPPVVNIPFNEPAPLRRERPSDYGMFNEDFHYDLGNYLHHAKSDDLFNLIRMATNELESKFWSLSPMDSRRGFIPPPPPMAGRLGRLYDDTCDPTFSPDKFAEKFIAPLQRQTSVMPPSPLKRQSSVVPQFSSTTVLKTLSLSNNKNSDATHIDVGDEGNDDKPSISVDTLNEIAQSEFYFQLPDAKSGYPTVPRNMKENDEL